MRLLPFLLSLVVATVMGDVGIHNYTRRSLAQGNPKTLNNMPKPRAFSYVPHIRKPWPPHTFDTPDLVGTFNTVFFCWTHMNARSAWKDVFEAAIQKWMCAAGPPGPQSNHALRFMEVGHRDRNGRLVPKFCYLESGREDTSIKDDVLFIYFDESQSESESTLGYKPSSVDSTRGRHHFIIGTDTDVVTLAHEIGHAIGLIHEATRPDRDQYVEFRCEMLSGFTAAVEKAMGDDNRLTEEEAKTKLCTDWDFADKYKFAATDFIKESGGTITGPFDMASIMMYPSEEGAGGVPACRANLDLCPMAKIERDAQGNKVGVSRIRQAPDPSPLDIAWLKQVYPWRR